jgi:hypothetical protein
MFNNLIIIALNFQLRKRVKILHFLTLGNFIVTN